MGLILDTSALVAWERAENAGQTPPSTAARNW
jgi:hypothetical protein